MGRLIVMTYLFIFHPYCCYGRDPQIINIPNQGTIMGKEIAKIRAKSIFAYLGVPYAQPPLARLRFQPPVIDDLPSWKGIRNATEYAPACLQPELIFDELNSFYKIFPEKNFETSEDCLYLNVFVPTVKAPKEGFATVIWFHPGNFTFGYPAMWNPYELVYNHEIIVITFAFRLNVFGFLTTLDGEAPGNYGLMDQQAVMGWAKKNIQLFGGNPDNICLMGYGTGGLSVGIHMVNLQSQQLFDKAIVMSGNLFSPSSYKYVNDYAQVLEDIAKKFSCYRYPTALLIDCLRDVVDVQVLLSFTSATFWRPLIDSGLSNSTVEFLPKPPRELFEDGNFAEIPLLTGFTNMEDALDFENLENEMIREGVFDEALDAFAKEHLPPVNENDTCMYKYDHVTDAVTFFYGSDEARKNPQKSREIIVNLSTDKKYGSSAYLLAKYLSKSEKTYVYRFDMKPSTSALTSDFSEWVQVPHLFDLIYVWGLPSWVPLKDQKWDDRDKKTATAIMSLWTNFIKYSNTTKSNTPGIVWDNFTSENPAILLIDRIFNMADQCKINYKAFDFWNEYFPKVMEVATRCCNATEPSSSTSLIYRDKIIIFTFFVYLIFKLNNQI